MGWKIQHWTSIMEHMHNWQFPNNYACNILGKSGLVRKTNQWNKNIWYIVGLPSSYGKGQFWWWEGCVDDYDRSNSAWIQESQSIWLGTWDVLQSYQPVVQDIYQTTMFKSRMSCPEQGKNGNWDIFEVHNKFQFIKTTLILMCKPYLEKQDLM